MGSTTGPHRSPVKCRATRYPNQLAKREALARDHQLVRQLRPPAQGSLAELAASPKFTWRAASDQESKVRQASALLSGLFARRTRFNYVSNTSGARCAIAY